MFEPKLEILPPAQRSLWAELDAIPAEFVLCGGTAIALQLGHRQSVDFDFFGSRAFDPVQLYSIVPLLNGSTVLQQAASTLSFFGDGDLPSLPAGVQQRIIAAARNADLDRLPALPVHDEPANP